MIPALLATLLASAPADPPAACLARAPDWSPVAAFLDSAVAAGAAPGAVVGVWYQGLRWVHGTGRLGVDDTTRPDGHTVYDLASLTKVVGLTTVLMAAVAEGRMGLDEAVARYLPAFVDRSPDARRHRVTIRLLLAHASGLPADRPLWKETRTAAEALALVDTTPLRRPPGDTTVYSDLGAIVLGQAAERALGAPLDDLVATWLTRPLGMADTRFRPPPDWRQRIAPTEDDPWRGRVLRGEVHDEKAAWLGGVAGHAGLFGSADDLLTFAEWLLARWHGEPLVREFTRRQGLVPGSSRALGWDTPAGPSGSAGRYLSAASFGHTGFTGTSLWLDPARDLAVVLLTNRVHPTRANQRIPPVRSGVADRAVLAACPGAVPAR